MVTPKTMKRHFNSFTYPDRPFPPFLSFPLCMIYRLQRSITRRASSASRAFARVPGAGLVVWVAREAVTLQAAPSQNTFWVPLQTPLHPAKTKDSPPAASVRAYTHLTCTHTHRQQNIHCPLQPRCSYSDTVRAESGNPQIGYPWVRAWQQIPEESMVGGGMAICAAAWARQGSVRTGLVHHVVGAACRVEAVVVHAQPTAALHASKCG